MVVMKQLEKSLEDAAAFKALLDKNVEEETKKLNEIHLKELQQEKDRLKAEHAKEIQRLKATAGSGSVQKLKAIQAREVTEIDKETALVKKAKAAKQLVLYKNAEAKTAAKSRYRDVVRAFVDANFFKIITLSACGAEVTRKLWANREYLRTLKATVETYLRRLEPPPPPPPTVWYSNNQQHLEYLTAYVAREANSWWRGIWKTNRHAVKSATAVIRILNNVVQGVAETAGKKITDYPLPSYFT